MFQSSFLISLKESKCNYSAVRLGFTQLTLQTAANKAKSSIRAKRPSHVMEKFLCKQACGLLRASAGARHPLDVLRRIFAIISRTDE